MRECLQFPTECCGLCLCGIWGMSLGCKHKPHLPASLGLSPTLSAFLELLQIQLRAGFNTAGFRSGRGTAGPVQPCTSQAGTEQDKGAPWTWECSGCKCTTAKIFFFSSAKNSFFSALCYCGFYSCSHPPQLSAQQTPAFHLHSDFVIHGWFQISLSAW